MKKYQVFVSSTYEDLKEQRHEVMNCLWSANCIPTGMEYFNASDSSQLEYIKNILNSTDIYVLIVGGRYGSIDPESGLSYTERECQIAKEKRIPVLAFICENPQQLPNEQVDNDLEPLNRFKNKLETKLIAHWNAQEAPAALAMKVMTSVTGLINEQHKELKGWNRGSLDDDDMPVKLLKATQEKGELQKNVDQLKEQNRELQAQLQQTKQDGMKEKDKELLRTEIQISGTQKDSFELEDKTLHRHLPLGRIFALLLPDIVPAHSIVYVMNSLESKLVSELHVNIELSSDTKDDIKMRLYASELIQISTKPDINFDEDQEIISLGNKGKVILPSIAYGEYSRPVVVKD